MQQDVAGAPHATAHFSRKLREVDSEALAVVEAVRHFDAHMYGCPFIM